MAVNGPAGGTVRLPALGEYDVGSARAMKVAQCIVAAGSTAGAAAAASDSNTFVNHFTDTQEAALALFNVEGPGIWVADVLSVVVTAFTASVTMTLGDTDLVDGWGHSEIILPTTTDQGYQASDSADQVDPSLFRDNGGKGKYMAASSAAVELVTAGADIAAGRLAVYAEYFVADNAIYG